MNENDTSSEQSVETPNQEVENNKDARLWGMFCHLSALLSFIGIPFGHLLGPLVIWLIKKNDFPFVDQQGKASLNFQLSLTLYALGAAVLIVLLIGIPLLIIIAIADIIFVILAAIKANNGESYQYPCTINFIK